MTADLHAARDDLRESGYDFTVSDADGATPILDGRVGVEYPEPESLLGRLLRVSPITVVPTDTAILPDDVLTIAARHGLEVQILGGDGETVYVVLSANGV